MLKFKMRCYITYIAVVTIVYIGIGIDAMRYNNKNVNPEDQDEHLIREVEKAVFMSGNSALAAGTTFPVIMVLFIIFQVSVKMELNKKPSLLEKFWKQYRALTVICILVSISTCLITIKFLAEFIFQDRI